MQQPQPRPHRQPRRTRQQWAGIVESHDQSGLSAKAFCEREALSYASFIKWRRELGGDRRTDPQAFVELTGADAPVTPVSTSGCLIELTIARSVVVRIHAA